MIVKVAGNQGNIYIPSLANGLAVVQRLQNGQKTRVLLYVAGDGVEVACSGMPRQLGPAGRGFVRGRDGPGHVVPVRLRDLGERLGIGRVYRFEESALGRLDPRITDEVRETPAMVVDPAQRRIGRLRGRPVLERPIQLSNTHHSLSCSC